MYNLSKFLFLVFLFWDIFLLNAEIIEIHSLNEIVQEFEQQDQFSLIIFDIDYVLLNPKDKILRFCGVELRKKFFANFLTDKNEEFYYNQMLLQTEEEVLEPISIQLIKLMQERKIPVIALTSRPTTAGGIPWQQLRSQTLKKLEIDFSGNFQNNIFTLKELNQKGPSPVFDNGILFANQYTKGETLKLFLNSLNIKPKQIIFIDDQITNLLSAEAELNGSEIKFLGVHDLFIQDLKEFCPQEIAEFQINYLFKTNKWLNDTEAKICIQNIKK